ncbi:MAG: hypothetical protein V4850_31325 [Myxococcota bacterium]
MMPLGNDRPTFLRTAVSLWMGVVILGGAPSCAGGSFSFPSDMVEAPGWAASEVPTNVVLLAEVSGADPVTALLTDSATGATIAVSVATATTPTGRWAWITPAAELTARTEYWTEVLLADGSARGSTRFSTGDGPDLDPPTGGALEAADVRARALYVQLSEPSDDAGDAYVELAVASDSEFVDQLSMPFLFTDPETPERLEIAALRFPSAGSLEGGDTLFLRSRAIDLGGNAGEWSDATSVEIHACATIPVRSSLLCLAAGALFALRGRRRTHRTRG